MAHHHSESMPNGSINISSTHFLSLPRPDVLTGPPPGVVDTTTLAAHDFDVDTRTGFMPPQAPLRRLPVDWEPWEEVLDDAVRRKLQLGDRLDLDEGEKINSEVWRVRVREVGVFFLFFFSWLRGLKRRLFFFCCSSLFYRLQNSKNQKSSYAEHTTSSAGYCTSTSTRSHHAPPSTSPHP